jgi:multiple sugar transport system permease protein
MRITTTQPRAVSHQKSRWELGVKARNHLGNFLAVFILSVGGLFMALPFLWMVSSSLKSIAEIYVFPPTFIPESIQWANYLEIWRRLPFHLFFRNSFVVATLETLGVLFTSSLAGYSFARLRYPGRDQLFLVYLSTMMIPFAVRMIPLFVLMRTFGWVDSLAALIVPSMFSAWGTFLMRQFMLTIPRELEDAALIDGCSYFRIYWAIILPLTMPALATLGIFHFMGSWNAFLWPLIILNSMSNKTLPLGLAAFQAMVAMKTPWHLVMAAAVVSVVPIMVIFMLGQKYYVRGIVTTGLKG